MIAVEGYVIEVGNTPSGATRMVIEKDNREQVKIIGLPQDQIDGRFYAQKVRVTVKVI